MALIYIVEDDRSIREIEKIALKNSNYEVEDFGKASELHRRLAVKVPNLILLDIMLPDESGYEILRKLRKNAATCRVPVIMVTAKTGEMDMVRGLDEGADDYIRKPFSVMELLSRVRAMLRRTQGSDEAILRLGDIEMNVGKHKVLAGGKEIELTFKEFELLRFLLENAEQALSREAIMRVVWGTDFEGESRTVDMHIKTLRQKLGEHGSAVRTVRNVGYMMQP